MNKENLLNNGIPISTSLQENVEAENFQGAFSRDKQRLLFVSCAAVVIAIAVSLIARILIYLINFFTNILDFYILRATKQHTDSPSNSRQHIGLSIFFSDII